MTPQEIQESLDAYVRLLNQHTGLPHDAELVDIKDSLVQVRVSPPFGSHFTMEFDLLLLQSILRIQ